MFVGDGYELEPPGSEMWRRKYACNFHTVKDVCKAIVIDDVHRCRAQSSDLKNGQMLPTMLKGSNLTVSLMKGVMIDGADSNATVTSANIMADNVRSLQAHKSRHWFLLQKFVRCFQPAGVPNALWLQVCLLHPRNNRHDACCLNAKC